MDKPEHMHKHPERHPEVEVTWIVEDTPERRLAWRRLWSLLLNRRDSGAHPDPKAEGRGQPT
jgi:hypothetical protein